MTGTVGTGQCQPRRHPIPMRRVVRRHLYFLACSLSIAGMPVCATVPPHLVITRSAPRTTESANSHSAASRRTPNLNALPTLRDISTFVSAGAPHLALEFIDRGQPDFKQDPVGWMTWERQRIYIYQTIRDWHAIIARAQHLPANVGPDFRQWEARQAAAAWLQLGNGPAARRILRRLIWSPRSPPDDATLGKLRQLVIQSFLLHERLNDAKTAIIRYRQDYPKDAGNWPLLEARLFLRTQQPHAALDILHGRSGGEVDMLKLLAALRAGTRAPAAVLKTAETLGNDRKLPLSQRAHAWYIVAAAATLLERPVLRIRALQNGLGLQPGRLDRDQVFAVTPGMLWDAYLHYGEALGNRLRLVVGDDESWYLAASNRYDSNPTRACALFSVVAFNAPTAQQRAVAHWQFASLIQKQRYGGVILRHLYLDSDRFPTVTRIPPDVRYILVDDVLKVADIRLASQLMQGLDAPPPNTDRTAWNLQRARVFILGGEPDAGIHALRQLFASGAAVPPGDVLPILFDLQAIGRNRDAIPFFAALLRADLTPDEQRQLLFWIADSYKALGDYTEAAQLYLRSATLIDPYAMDQWAQSARFQAARMLAKAGYIADARNLYQGLVNATQDPSEQAILRRDMQRLILMSKVPAHSP